jgi:hypothetical protein
MSQQLIRLAREHRSIISDAASVAADETRGLLEIATRRNDNFAYGLLRENVPEILSTFGTVVGTIDSTYYSNLRELAGVSTLYSPELRPVNWAQVAAPISGFAIARTRQGLDFDSTLTLIAGNVSAELFNYSRQNVVFNAQRDPTPVRYRRVTRPKACDFCMYMATGFEGDGSNESYKNYHTNCGCVDVPIFEGQDFVEPAYYDEFRQETTRARENIAEYRAAARAESPGMKDRDFFRKYPEAALNTSNIVKQVRNVRLGNPLELP